MKDNDVMDVGAAPERTCPQAQRRRRRGSVARPRAPGARAALAALATTAVLLTAPGAAEAAGGKLVDLHGSVLLGGMTGRGTDGATPDFFRQSQGAGFGAELGARLLILDVSIRFLQMVGPSGYGGTVLTGLVGPMMEIPVKSGGTDLLGKPRPPLVVVRPGLAAGLAFGTKLPVDPPLNNSQLASKGLLVIGRFGVERMFGPILGVGGEIQGGYHYMFGAQSPINGKDHSDGWQGSLFGTVSFHLGI